MAIGAECMWGICRHAAAVRPLSHLIEYDHGAWREAIIEQRQRVTGPCIRASALKSPCCAKEAWCLSVPAKAISGSAQQTSRQPRALQVPECAPAYRSQSTCR